MRTIYIATGDDFVRAINDEESWETRKTLRGAGIQCLAVDPHEPALVYAGSRGRGVWRSQDGGESWRQMCFPESDVFSVAVSAADGAVYAGCEPSALFVSRDQGQSWQELESLKSIPSAPDWSFPPRPWTSHVRWIAPSPHDADLLLVGIELGGLMRSMDGGKTWADHRPGAQPDVHAVAWHPVAPERAYEAGGGGAAWSHDAGETWHAADVGRHQDYTWGLAVNPTDPNSWFISAAPGPREAHDGDKSAQAAIYRWHINGHWEPLDALPQPLDSLPYALAMSSTGLVAGLGDGRLFLSEDQGNSWDQLVLRGDPLPSVRALAWAESIIPKTHPEPS
ncbi:MAG: hypothetical protein KDA52_00755 [Planctomycetaceae bacterium]|nr:hypothetical protein [Planctomycetaceae bacterium]